MTSSTNPPLGYAELRALIARARRRWRLRVGLRGAGIVLASALVVIIVSSYGMERWRYGDGAILAFRIFAWIALLALIARFVVLPLVRRASDERIALYLEEHEPALDAALLSAVEESRGEGASRQRSAALAAKVVESAVARARALTGERDPERRGLQRAAGLVAAVAAAGMALILLGPSVLRQGALLLAVPWGTAEAAPVYAVMVEPGNARLARGGDQEIRAHLRGFGAEEAELSVRRGATGTWERIPMSPGADSGAFAARVFDLDEATQYFVEANGVRSPVYTLEVTDLPAVRRIDLEYRYPAYTGLAPQKVEDGGDVAAVRGTAVRVRALPTRAVRGGRLVIDGEPPIAMALDSAGALSGELRITRPGFYKIELQAEDGSMVSGSLDYAIDVLDDNAPTVTFRTPGRDLRVTSLEEVFAEVVAEDDYGVQSLELLYRVNGGAEQSIVLHRGGGRPRKEVAAGHTFYLEELGLQPGDVVSYFARARDGDRAGGPAKASATDIYFMEVRPFEREYRQAEQGGMPGGGGQGEDESPSALSQRQREIVAATFKVVRDSAALSTAERRDNLSTIALGQGTLRERVEALATRLSQRGVVGADSALRVIGQELPLAAAAMREAEERLGRRLASDALPPEQRALQHLQRAEAAYREVEVSFGQQGGQGSGAAQQNPEELADLFELDRDKLRNQYESVQRGGRSEAQDRQVDETLEKLRALAARQQQENERAQRRADAMRQQGGGGGGGTSQRQLAEETEEAARQLERLARERQSQELAETARRLQDAASAMRRSAASGKDAGAAEGAAALDRIQEARRLLDQERSARLERDAQQTLRAAEELARRQKDVAADVGRMREGQAAPKPEELQRLTERKDAMAQDIERLEGQLDRLARDARRDQRDAARKLGDAAGEIREKRIADKVRYSRGVMRAGSPEYARSFEDQIGADLEGLRERIAGAVGAIGEPSDRGSAEALDRARNLVRGLESLRDRSQNANGGARDSVPGARDGAAQRPGAAGTQDAGRRAQDAAGTAQDAGRRTQESSPGGSSQGAGFGGRSNAEALTPEQIRQLTREYRARRGSADSLRRELRGQGIETESLEALIEQMRALEGNRIYDDPAELERLQASVIEGFKAFEFALQRQLAGGRDDTPVLGGTSDVPPEFRAMVEEYYRSLARSQPSTKKP